MFFQATMGVISSLMMRWNLTKSQMNSIMHTSTIRALSCFNRLEATDVHRQEYHNALVFGIEA